MEEEEENIKEWAFVIPEDIKYDKNIYELSDIELIRWHDMMHVFFEKLLDGIGEYSQFRWTFNSVIHKHEELIKVMSERGIHHYGPYNNLDLIKSNVIYSQIYEKKSNELSENQEILESIDLSINPPIHIDK